MPQYPKSSPAADEHFDWTPSTIGRTILPRRWCCRRIGRKERREPRPTRLAFLPFEPLCYAASLIPIRLVARFI